MRKCMAIIITAALLAGLAGCNKSMDSEDSSGTVSETVFVGEVTYNGSTTAETFLTGLDGKAVTAAEITRLIVKDSKMDGVLDETDFEWVECDGFAYAFKTRAYLNESANSEIINEDDNLTEFIRVNVGDKFGGLTVKSARTVYSALNMNDAYYEGSEIEFDGEITLTGELNIPMEVKNYPYEYNLFMTFKPESFPISLNFSAIGGKFYHYVIPGLGSRSDVPTISLGTLRDCDIDLDGMSDGFTYRAQITVDNVKMCCGIQGYAGGVEANLLNVKRL